MSHGPAGTGLGLAGIGVGLLIFLADRLEWGISPLADAVLIVLAIVLTVAGIGYVGYALLLREKVEPIEIVYAVGGHSEMQVGTHDDRPQIVLLQVGLRNPNPFNLEGVAVNSLIPQGLQQGRCDAHGRALGGGQWFTTSERLTAEPAPGTVKDYWADENVTIAGNGSKLLFFKLKVVEPGNLHLKTLLFGNAPEQYRETILEVVPQSYRRLGTMIGELIYQGERLLAESVDGGLPDALWTWLEELEELRFSIPDQHQRWWLEATAAGDGVGLDATHVGRTVAALYDLRRRLEPSDLDRPGGGIHAAV